MADGADKIPAWQRLAEADAAALEAAAGRGVPGGLVDDGGALGAAAAGIFGAGSSATFGLSDLALSEGAYALGGRDFQKQVLGNVSAVRERNPYATMAGEAAGLFINPSLSAAGEAVEARVARGAGEGLLGSMAAFGARGAFEGAALGAQKQITEDTLGDHAYNGEAIFASAAKDALLGGALGAALGAGAYGFRRGGSALLASKPGPMSDAVLDEIAGVPGAGRKLADDARQAETVIEGLRKTGMTGEQAVKMADEIGHTAKAATKDGAVTEFFDAGMERAIQQVERTNPERAALMRQEYANKTRQMLDGQARIERHALEMSEKGTKVLRNLEDVVNDVQFTSKSEQFAKLVDKGLGNAQRDQVARLLQDTDDVLKFWESTAAKGGAEGSIRTIRKNWQDALNTLSKVEEAGGEAMSRDLFIRTDKLKRSLDKTLQWGRENRFGLPEAITHSEMGLESLANKYRGALEDASVWGKAGDAQARWNASFSTAKARRDHFMSELGVAIDQQAGIRIPEIDFAKARSLLSGLKGGETDAALQGVKSTEAAISGFRDRVQAIREFGDLTPKQIAQLEKGMADLDAFEGAFRSAREEAASVNRLKEAVMEERDAGSLGGLIGLVGDSITKPLTTIARLAQVRQTVNRVEEGVVNGLKKFFGGTADEAATRIASNLKPRAKEAIAKEVGDIAALRGNPIAMEERARKLVGDLEAYAPKTANEVRLTAIRALDYLAREAPRPSVPMGLIALDARKARYSDQQLSDWEAKRRAALDPESVVRDLQKGKLNRDAIKAVEFVSPKLFAKMQELAQEQIMELAAKGKLDAMPYQQKAAISTLLKVPADQTWTPDFIQMIQAAKVAPPPAQAAPQGPNTGVSKRAVEIDTSAFATGVDAIEKGTP